MPDRPKEFDGFSIVVGGSFNPAIFHPLWFVANKLIRKEEGDEAEIEVTHREAALFKTSWFALQVTHDRFMLNSDDPAKGPPIRDLAAGTFAILEHTPVFAYGFHRMMHFKMESEDAWHEFGHFCAPKAPWSDSLKQPGLKSLTVQGTADGIQADVIFIRLEPSAQIIPGVYLHVHLHRGWNPSTLSPAESMKRLQAALASDWSAFTSYSTSVATQLFAKFDSSRS